AEAPRAYVAQAEWELGHRRAAIQTCADALALAPHHLPAWYARGRMHQVLGELEEAERCWKGVLELVRGDPGLFAYCDPRFEALRARRELKALAVARGDHAEAARLNRDMLAHCPEPREGPAAGSASSRGRLGAPHRRPVAAPQPTPGTAPPPGRTGRGRPEKSLTPAR